MQTYAVYTYLFINNVHDIINVFTIVSQKRVHVRMSVHPPVLPQALIEVYLYFKECQVAGIFPQALIRMW